MEPSSAASRPDEVAAPSRGSRASARRGRSPAANSQVMDTSSTRTDNPERTTGESRAAARQTDIGINLASSYAKRQRDVSLSDWIKAFLVTLLVLKAVSSLRHHHDASAHVENVWLVGINGSADLCTSTSSSSEHRCKRHPAVVGGTTSPLDRPLQYCLRCFVDAVCLRRYILDFYRKLFRQPGTPCWTRPCQSVDVDQGSMWSDNVGKQLGCCGRRRRHDDVPPAAPSPLENPSLLPLQLAEEMVTSPLPTTTRLGDEDAISLMEEQLMTSNLDHADVDTNFMSMRGHDVSDHGRIIPDCIADSRVEELTGLDSTDASAMGLEAERPAADNQMRHVPLWSMPGFRFLPTDLEIVLHYLKRKLLNLGLPQHDAVKEGVDVHGTNADEITLDIDNGDKEQLGFFFVRKEQAYTNGCWYATPGGYWKVRRGQPAAIEHGGRVVAFKTTMDYVRGRAPRGRRTPWNMSEYALNGRHHDDLRNLAQPTMNSFVVCKVQKRVRVAKPSVLLRRFGMKNRVRKDRDQKPKVRRLVRAADGVRGVLGKRKRPDLF